MGERRRNPLNIEQILQSHGDRLYRLCFLMLGSDADAQDAVQDTLIRYLEKAPTFRDAEHEKAWLLRVAANRCRDTLRLRIRQIPMEPEHLEQAAPEAPDKSVLEALSQLPEKYRIVLLLHYVEDCKVNQIAKTIGATPSAVKMRLQKGRKLLEEIYRKEYL